MKLDLSAWGWKEGDSVRDLVAAILDDHGCCVRQGEGVQLLDLVVKEATEGSST